jgi:hypothetical protein
MNAPTERPIPFALAVRLPSSSPRSFDAIARDAAELAQEIAEFAAGDGPFVASLAYSAMTAAVAELRDLALLEGEYAVVAASELSALCAHCGHERGEHLVEAPHACEEMHAEGLDAVSACRCPGFVAPGEGYVCDTERPPPPAANDH